MFEEKLNEWAKKVIATKNSGCAADTYRMIFDIDQIIAEAFDHAPVLENE